MDGKDLVLGVWDTAGSERYESMSRMYYRNAKETFLVNYVDQDHGPVSSFNPNQTSILKKKQSYHGGGGLKAGMRIRFSDQDTYPGL